MAKLVPAPPKCENCSAGKMHRVASSKSVCQHETFHCSRCLKNYCLTERLWWSGLIGAKRKESVAERRAREERERKTKPYFVPAGRG